MIGNMLKAPASTKRRTIVLVMIAMTLIAVPVIVVSTAALASRHAIRRMIERDFKTDDITITLHDYGWDSRLDWFYVDYEVTVPNDGTFIDSVPRMWTLAEWSLGHELGATGYVSDVFPEPWDERVPLQNLWAQPDG